MRDVLTANDVLQRLSHEVGWGYKDVVDRLEEKRKIKAKAFHDRKVSTARGGVCVITSRALTSFQLAAVKLRQKAIGDTAEKYPKLAELGY
jgi:large subunit ribosomal protein L13Ae